MQPSSIYFSTASIPPATMNKIRHRELPDPPQDYGGFTS